ncbi:6262_t:CDS:2 [Entrophospora sp. SA101]|nr:4573_t:CDS:2 [Entrophospora sp. SA101]CAJ0836632.1 6262_t:CDS:2 [Entrophospora sp. SA101]
MNYPTPTLSELKEQTTLGQSTIEKIIEGFLSSYHNGLTKDHSTMVPSYITRLPTGIETGDYLALDLGGTNLRVAVVTLVGLGKTELMYKQYRIPDELKTGTVEELFDWVALAVKGLLDDSGHNNLENDGQTSNLNKPKELYMGVTFSFPINQTAVKQGVVMQMGKGFNVIGLENHDGVKVHIAVIVNDTVGTLVANAYKDQNTIISVILGTGTNAACISTTSSISKIKFPPNTPEYMIVNTEWGIMGADFLPFIKYDKVLDLQSKIPGFQPFEKMVSGMYLGELVRLTIVDHVKSFNLFGGFLPGGMEIPYNFSTIQMSDIESDKTANRSEILKILLKGFKFPDDKKPSKEDMKIVCEIIKAYSRRSAQLSAVAVASLIKLQCPDFPSVERDIRVAIDGSMYHKYYKYAEKMSEFLRQIQDITEDKRTKLSEIENGGCTGISPQLSSLLFCSINSIISLDSLSEPSEINPGIFIS